jgi:sterol desaturase/sphingolipid hydroxylase (fatty acid hydroxylase superfamily)
MKHHYQNPDAGFGVSQSFWDLVFGTGYPKEK